LNAAIAAAEAVVNSTWASAAEVSQALGNLVTAIAQLQSDGGVAGPTPTPTATQPPASTALDVAKAKLDTLVAIGKALQAANYDAVTFKALQDAITAGEAAAKTAKTVAEFDAASAKITAAITALKPAAAQTPAVKVTTKTVKVAGKAFKKAAKPKVTVTVTLSSGTAKGKVAVYVGKKKVKTVTVSKAKTTIKLPKKYSKAISVKAKYTPSAAANGTAKTSKAVKIKVKK
jgi:hypothetical protein